MNERTYHYLNITLLPASYVSYFVVFLLAGIYGEQEPPWWVSIMVIIGSIVGVAGSLWLLIAIAKNEVLRGIIKVNLQRVGRLLKRTMKSLVKVAIFSDLEIFLEFILLFAIFGLGISFLWNIGLLAASIYLMFTSWKALRQMP